MTDNDVSVIYLNVHEEEVMTVPSFLHRPVEEHQDCLLLENQKKKCEAVYLRVCTTLLIKIYWWRCIGIVVSKLSQLKSG